MHRMKDKSNPYNLVTEKQLISDGYRFIAGIDEVGRGPFAGPLVAAAVIMPIDFRIEKLTDSKKIPKKHHGHFADLVKENALSYGISVIDVNEFDEIGNVITSTRLAMKRAVEQLHVQPDFLLVDGTEKVQLPIDQLSIVKGDYNSHSISSAAIIAKVYRDEIMKNLDEEFGCVYHWSKNAGYLTKKHQEAIKEHGLTKYHRKSWTNVWERFE